MTAPAATPSALEAIVREQRRRSSDGRTRVVGVRAQPTWEGGPLTYLGLMVSGFPNMFIVTGPGSPGVKTQMIASIEQHVDWIADCIGHLRQKGFDRIEASPQAELDWVEHVNKVADSTLYPLANSWYMGANIPGKPRVFMPYVGGYDRYKRHCEAIAAKGYEGFILSKQKQKAPVA